MIGKRAILRAMAGLNQAKPRPYLLTFGGGLDEETPPLMVPPGFLRAARNVECRVNGGYETADGYQRFDGRTEPSTAVAYVIDITLTGAISTGDTVTGVTSLATGVVIATASGYIAYTKASGALVSGETLNVGGVGQATTTSAPHAASTALLRAQYKNLAADQYRNDIAAPTGSGSNLGGVELGDVLYTWRNNAGGTAANLWKSTTSGWSQITLYNEVSFTAGAVAAPADGETLTQGGVTATVKRAVTQNQTTAWAGAATGRLIVTNPAGGNFAAGAATLSGGGTCTLSGAQTAITLLPSGRYECIVENFGGSVNTKRVYGCDGVNRGFEFDGTVLVPIATGMSSDIPNHVGSNMNHLFFSFSASVQHASPGYPYVWSVVLGASEIAMGDTVNGFAKQPGSATAGAYAIFTRNKLSILNGTGVANWQKIDYRAELGAYAYSIQDVGYTMFFDDQGITNLQTSQAFGNFSHQSLSRRIYKWLNNRRQYVVGSCVSRVKSQYRLFFSDQYMLYVTFSGNKVVGMTPIRLKHTPTWAWSGERANGTEVIYFGGTNGMVYQMEKGTSFDGEAIDWRLYFSWDSMGSPRLVKRFHGASVEIAGEGYAELSYTYRLSYATTEIAQPGTQSEVTNFSASIWDSGIQWDNFVWDGRTLLPSLMDMGGEAENVSHMFSGNSDYHEVIRFSAMTVDYSPRRQLR